MTCFETIQVFVSLALFAACIGLADSASGESGDMPPLIDRQVFFGDPEYAGAQISPDGEFVAFRRPHQGVMNVWVKPREAEFAEARPLTADRRPVPAFLWSQDSRFILYVQDRQGDENFHVYAVDPAAEAEQETGVPPARNLTPYEGVRARLFAAPKSRPREIMVGINDRDPRVHDVYRVDLDSGQRERIIKNDQNVASWTFDLDGQLRLGSRQRSDGGTDILRVDDGQLTVVYSGDFGETCSPLRFHPDGRRVYLVTNVGARVDRTRLVLFDPQTREEELVEADPEAEVDFGGADFSRATDELVATYYVGDRQRVYPRDETFARDLEVLRNQLPEGELSFGASTDDESLRIVSVARDVDPGATYLYNRETGETQLLYRARPELPVEHLAAMEPIRYTARDGLEIPGYLTLPRGLPAEALPLVVMPHGGPWARDTWGYDPYVQFLANRGYAVFQPNFRGSTGFGKAFLNAGNQEWGTGAMQHDITDGVKHLIEKGWADPERVGIFGASYGGYATLAGLAFTPDLYAAGVSYVGPSNLLTLIRSIPPYWEPVREQFYRRVGNPEDPEDKQRLIEQSPLFSAHQMQAPLLVLQGANDPRVTQAESDQIVVALRERGYPVEYLLAEDEGHGFRDPWNRLASTAAIEQFFAQHLQGRYQESLAPPTRETRERLTVDVQQVEAPAPVAPTN